MGNRCGWTEKFDHVWFNGQVALNTTAGGILIPTGSGNWVAQSVNQQGTIKAIDGEPGTDGIIELASHTALNSQLVLWKGFKPGVGAQSLDPVFGSIPATDVRAVRFRARIPGSFAENMGFRLTVTNRMLFPDAATASVGIFYDHQASGTNDPLMHALTRSGVNVLDTPFSAPTPGAWLEFTLVQDTPLEWKIYYGSTLIATHWGASVPNLAAVGVSMQVFNRLAGTAKKLHVDTVEFDPRLIISVPACASPIEVALALGPVSGTYVVGKHPKLYPNVEEAIQDINASGNPPSAINRVCVGVMPGQYTQPLYPIAVPAFTTIAGGLFGGGYTNTELLRARFVCDGDTVNFENFFVATTEEDLVHFDLAGHSAVIFTDIKQLSSAKLVTQSGSTWVTVGFFGLGISYFGTAGYPLEFHNTAGPRNVDVFFVDPMLDAFNLDDPGGVCRVTGSCQDFRITSGEARCNSPGIGWRIEGAQSKVRFSHHRTEAIQGIVSDSRFITLEHTIARNSSIPATIDPVPVFSHITA